MALTILILIIGLPVYLIVQATKKKNKNTPNQLNSPTYPTNDQALQRAIESLTQKKLNAKNEELKQGIQIAIDELQQISGSPPASFHYPDLSNEAGGRNGHAKPDTPSFDEKGRAIIPRGALGAQPLVANSAVQQQSTIIPSHEPSSPILHRFDRVNLLLLGGSLMIILSALFFINSDTIGLNGTAKFAIIASLTVLFYGVGLLLRKSSESFLPAAIAFTGIGVAVMPLLVFALTSFTDVEIALNAQLAVSATIAVFVSAFTHRFFDNSLFVYSALSALLASIVLWTSAANANPLLIALAASLSSYTMIHASLSIKDNKINPAPFQIVGASGATVAYIITFSTYFTERPLAFTGGLLLLNIILNTSLTVRFKDESKRQIAMAGSAFLAPAVGITILQTSTDELITLNNALYGLTAMMAFLSALSLLFQRSVKESVDPLNASLLLMILIGFYLGVIGSSVEAAIAFFVASTLFVLARGILAKQKSEEPFLPILTALLLYVPVLLYAFEAMNAWFITLLYLTATAAVMRAILYFMQGQLDLRGSLRTALGIMHIAYTTIAFLSSLAPVRFGQTFSDTAESFFEILPLLTLPILAIFTVDYARQKNSKLGYPIAGALSYVWAILTYLRLPIFEDVSGLERLWITVSVVAIIHTLIGRVFYAKNINSGWMLSGISGLAISAASALFDDLRISSVLVLFIAAILLENYVRSKNKSILYGSFYILSIAASLVILFYPTIDMTVPLTTVFATSGLAVLFLELRAQRDKKLKGSGWIAVALATAGLTTIWELMNGEAFIASGIAVIAGVVLIESYRATRNRSALYAGYYVITFAVSVAVFQIDSLDSILLQSILWSIPSFMVAAHELGGRLPHPQNLLQIELKSLDRAHSLIVLGLATATVPTSALALVGSSLVGPRTTVALLVLNILILIVGAVARIRVVAIWGLVSVVINIIWQTRDILLGIPRLLLVFIGGVVLIGIAVMILLRETKSKK